MEFFKTDIEPSKRRRINNKKEEEEDLRRRKKINKNYAFYII